MWVHRGFGADSGLRGAGLGLGVEGFGVLEVLEEISLEA